MGRYGSSASSSILYSSRSRVEHIGLQPPAHRVAVSSTWNCSPVLRSSSSSVLEPPRRPVRSGRNSAVAHLLSSISISRPEACRCRPQSSAAPHRQGSSHLRDESEAPGYYERDRHLGYSTPRLPERDHRDRHLGAEILGRPSPRLARSSSTGAAIFRGGLLHSLEPDSPAAP